MRDGDEITMVRSDEVSEAVALISSTAPKRVVRHIVGRSSPNKVGGGCKILE
jgi:hypothetical protein